MTTLPINHQSRAHSNVVGGSTARSQQLYNRKTPEADPAVLREWLNYDPITGALTWRKSPNWSVKVGAVVGSINDQGYRKFKLFRVSYTASRAIWAMVHDYWPDVLVDHANANRDANWLTNLRLATNADNAKNAKGTRAGLKGATWHKCASAWAAQIRVDGRNKHLGLFSSEQAAHVAYCRAAVAFYGEFARFG